MADRDLNDLDRRLYVLCQQWIQACEAQGLRVGISQTYRSSAEQDADYAQGRTEPGKIITNARGGQSPHNCVDDDGNPASRAFDFFLYDADGSSQLDWDASDAQWQKAIAIGKGLGLVSGGDWHSIKDFPHMELPNWQASEADEPATHNID